VNLTKNFTFEELTATNHASLQNENIQKADAYVENIRLLATNLQQLRDALNTPISISSGFRCDELNRAVGGAKYSSHTLGLAADITTPSMEAKELFEFIRANPTTDLYKVILERVHGREWVHFAIADAQDRKAVSGMPIFMATTDGKNYERV
jgi:zinc D-Ala-D-Ala carboxypeptidase